MGAVLATLIWYLPFFAFPLFCLLSVFMMIILVPAPSSDEATLAFAAFIKKIKTIFKREGRWLFSVFAAGGICMYILFGVLFYLSTVLEDQYQIEGIKKGIILAIPLATLCLSSYVTGKQIGQKKDRMKWIIVVGFGLITLATFTISFSKDIYILLTALVASGIGIGVVLPSLDALVTAGIVKEQRGSVTSIYSSMRFVGIAVGPPAFAFLMKGSHFLLFFLQYAYLFTCGRHRTDRDPTG